ncbi:hypothetical protein ACFC1T_08685 [Kitasatospora sp. NPDC056076]|uniref:hypothetical protein n=1 Tax=Kitasatospora sp. NPDC056076 TaxID=3345703 RepID=UPI0035E2FB6F
MSRCGCSGACACLIVGGDSVDVTGNGSTTSRYVPNLNFNKAGSTACLRIMRDCIPRTVGEGLRWVPPVPDDPTKPGKLDLKISGDPGNLVKIGTDGGLFVPTGTPAGLSCTRDVTKLTQGTVWGRTGIGPVEGPWNLLKSMRMAQAAGLDGILIDLHILADGTVVCIPDTTFASGWVYYACILQPEDAPCSTTYGYLPYLSFKYDDINVEQWKNLLITTQDWFDTGVANQWGANSLMEVLDEMGGKICIALSLSDANFRNAANKVRLRQNVLRDIQRTCTEKSVVVLGVNYRDLAPFTAAGIQTGINVGSFADLDNNPAAAVQGAGVQWAFLNWRYRNHPEFTKYQPAGIKTMMIAAGRDAQKPTVTGAPYNAFGICTDDGPYTTGRGRALRRDLWKFRGMPEGQIHAEIDAPNYAPRVRGFRWDDQGAWVMPPAGAGVTVRQLTLGWATPFPAVNFAAGQSLRIQWEQMMQPTQSIPAACSPAANLPGPPAGSSFGMCVLMDTDQPATDQSFPALKYPPVVPDPGPPYDPPTYFSCMQDTNGNLTITGRYNNAPTAPASAVGTNPGATKPLQGTWQLFQILIDQNAIIFRSVAANGSDISRATLTITTPPPAQMRSNWNSRYLALRKNKPNNSAADFYGCYRNLVIDVI